MGHSTVKCLPSGVTKCLPECVLEENNVVQKKGDKRKAGIVILRNFSCKHSQMSKLAA